MRICFIRHGDNVDDKLTRLGKLQAKLVCNDLFYEDISCIYTSPKQRTLQTAKIIAKKLKISNITIASQITERSQPTKTNLSTQELAEFNQRYLDYEFSRQNPEGCKEYIDRCFAFLEQIIKTHAPKNENVLIVGHSSFAYALNSFFTGIPKDNELVWMRVGNCSKLCYEVYKKEN